MSLLGSQVYANPDTPIWVSATGDTITGDLVVTGSITCTGPGINVVDDGNGFSVLSGGSTVETRIQHIQGIGPRTLFESADPIYFNQPGQVNGNTNLQISAPLSQADLLTVGGNILVSGTVTTTVLAADGIQLPVAVANAPAGKSAIVVGTDTVVVNTTAVGANSIVLITRQGAPTAGPGNGANQGTITVPSTAIVPGVSFEAYLVDPTTGVSVAASLVNAEFSWVIIN
jgi:hypothetical protein